MSDEKDTLPEDYFNDVYRNSNDPWNFETSEYESKKYLATLHALTKDHYKSAFEIGCSIGVLTEMLAPRCASLLAVDAAEAPLILARRRLNGFAHVTVEKMAVPEQFPEEEFDLIMLSEVGYYFAMPDLKKLQAKMLQHLKKGGQLLLVHWTPEVHDYPLTGDQVHEVFISASGPSQPLKLLHSVREETYRLDSFEKQ